MFQKKPIVIDMRGHLLGRVAAVVAKELLCGQRIVCVRCELAELSGSLFRNKMDAMMMFRKKCNTNKGHGQYNYRSPAKMFWHAVRGMIPYKTARGVEALRRLKVFNGIPYPYSQMKRQCIPNALRAIKLAPNRKFTVVGDLAEQLGWTRKAVVAKYEKERKVKSAAYYHKKRQMALLRKKAVADVEKKGDKQVAHMREILRAYGY